MVSRMVKHMKMLQKEMSGELCIFSTGQKMEGVGIAVIYKYLEGCHVEK